MWVGGGGDGGTGGCYISICCFGVEEEDGQLNLCKMLLIHRFIRILWAQHADNVVEPSSGSPSLILSLTLIPLHLLLVWSGLAPEIRAQTELVGHGIYKLFPIHC